jgi:hypothetical protein
VVVVLLWCCCGVVVVLLWCGCGVVVVLLWCGCGVVVVWLWCAHTTTIKHRYKIKISHAMATVPAIARNRKRTIRVVETTAFRGVRHISIAGGPVALLLFTSAH